MFVERRRWRHPSWTLGRRRIIGRATIIAIAIIAANNLPWRNGRILHNGLCVCQIVPRCCRCGRVTAGFAPQFRSR